MRPKWGKHNGSGRVARVRTNSAGMKMGVAQVQEREVRRHREGCKGATPSGGEYDPPQQQLRTTGKISPRGYFVTSFPSPCTARVTNDEPPFGTVIFWSLFSAPPTHGDSLFQSNRLTRRRGHLFHTLLVTFGALNTVIFTDFT